MNDSQQAKIGKFPQTICLVIVAIHWALCLAWYQLVMQQDI